MSRRVYQIAAPSKQSYANYSDSEEYVIVRQKPNITPRTQYIVQGEEDDESDVETVYMLNGKYYKNRPVVAAKPSNVVYAVEGYDDYSSPEVIISPRSKSKAANQIYYVGESDDDQMYSPRSRVYVPNRTRAAPVPRSQSIDWVSRENPSRTYVLSKPASTRNQLHEVIMNKKLPPKKINHRREIEEPKVRDRPLPNKPVIHGGAVVYK